MNFNKTGKVFTSKFVETGPSSYKKKNLLGHGLIKVENHCSRPFHVSYQFIVFLFEHIFSLLLELFPFYELFA
jgi:hypothetical protein